MASKAAEAFRTISEVADELAVPKHVLRFWEQKFPQVRPMKRGGGRRYYRPEDLDLLRGIHHLLHNEGYTIRGVQKILRSQGLEQVKTCWIKDAKPAAAATGAAGKADVRATEAAPKPKGRPAKRLKVALPPELRGTVERALAELEACRAILAASGVQTAVRDQRSSRRAGR